MKRPLAAELLRLLSGLCIAWLATTPTPLESVESKRVRIEIVGTRERGLRHQLVSSTTIPAMRHDERPWQRGELRRAVQEQIPRWHQVLHAFGYYDAQLRVRIRQTYYHWVIELSLAPGPAYQLRSVSLLLHEGQEPHPLPLPIECQLPQRTTATYINELEQLLLAYYHNSGYARASLLSKQLELNSIDKSAKLTWTLAPGPFYLIGPIEITGLRSIDSDFVKRRILFKSGEPYNRQLIEQTQNELDSSNQFRGVAILHDWQSPQEGVLPLSVTLSERSHRTISFGANLMTEAGLGLRALWEHRNLSGQGDLLSALAHYSQRQRSASLLYTQPDFLPHDTVLRWQLEFREETIRPYSDRSWEWGVFLEQRRLLQLSCGVNFEYLQTTRTSDDSKKWLVSLPLVLDWNSTRHQAHGHSHQLQLTPYLALGHDWNRFVRMVVKNSFYLPLAEELTLALGFHLGALLGSSRHEIPPPLRFFKGGPNSFRGYAYKTLSPLSPTGQPEGGRSFALFQVEPRYRIGEQLSIVPFFEMGRVFTKTRPGLSGPYVHCVGIGVNYTTLIGPIRFDLALPLNRRANIDPYFQIYLSMGASF